MSFARYLFSFGLLFTLSLAFAGTPECRADTPQQQTENFLGELGRGNVDKAFDDLSTSSTKKVDVLFPLKNQARAALTSNGNALAIERVAVEDLTPSFARTVYLQKFLGTAVIWELYFYRATDSWSVMDVRMSDQPGQFFSFKR